MFPMICGSVLGKRHFDRSTLRIAEFRDTDQKRFQGPDEGPSPTARSSFVSGIVDRHSRLVLDVAEQQQDLFLRLVFATDATL